jgi:hypothetical protein
MLSAQRAGLPVRVILEATPIIAVAAIAGARAWYVAGHWPDYAADWQSTLFLWEGGLSLDGAVAGGLVGTLLAGRLEHVAAGRLCDAVAPAAALAIAAGQMGCLLMSCASGPGPVALEPQSPLVGGVPLEAGAPVALALAGVALLLVPVTGTAGLLLAWYGLVRATATSFEAVLTATTNLAGLASGLAFGAAGLLWLGLVRWRRRTAARG